MQNSDAEINLAYHFKKILSVWNVSDKLFTHSMCVGEHDSHKTISLTRFLTFLYTIGKKHRESLKYFQGEKEGLQGTN